VTCTVTDPSSTNYLKDCSSKRCSGGGTVTNQFGTFTISGGVAACVTDADCAALPGGTWGTCSLGLDPTTPGCTSGFVVSLSEPDPGQSDITMTIAKRAATDASNIGYAGRESVRKSTAFGPTLNTNQASDGNVRGDTYLLSRRLWLQDTCNQVSGTPVTTDSTDQSPGRDAAECQFFQWATDELPQVSQKAGRENIDPILKRWGFITCTDDNSQPTGNGNLCSKNYADGSGFPNGAGAPNKCILNNATTSGWTAKACTGTDPCCSDGKACNDNSHGDGAGGFKCPAPAGRAKGAACRFDAECASASCDGFATATVGACL